MDEIEIVKIIKKLIKIFLIILLPLILIIFINKMLIENSIINSILDFIITILTQAAFLILVVAIQIALFEFISKIRKITNSKININKNKEYIRDIEIKYSPAIISFILDLYTSSFKDYTATILYLCYRKYIEMYKENDDIKFRVINENVNELNPHEQYVYRCITGSGFNQTKFEELVIEDARGLGLISKSNGKIIRTAKGKNEANLWKGFKNYLHDYTLIADKGIEHMVILNEYIPYAIALDEAKSIEKFIAKDESYRNLIYKFYNGNNS